MGTWHVAFYPCTACMACPHYNGHGFNFGNFISHYRHLMSDKSPERVCFTGDVIISNDCKVTSYYFYQTGSMV